MKFLIDSNAQEREIATALGHQCLLDFTLSFCQAEHSDICIRYRTVVCVYSVLEETVERGVA